MIADDYASLVKVVNEHYWVTQYHYEREIERMSNKVVEELSNGNTLTSEEMFNRMVFIRYSEEIFKAFFAMISRKLIDKGLVLVTCPIIDMDASNTVYLTINGYLYKAVPIHVPEERYVL